MLDVRAVGYFPQERAVDVLSESAAVDVSLSTIKSVLDTVRVTAKRVFDRDRSGFLQRRKTGAGRYFSDEDLSRMPLSRTSDVFHRVLGVHVVRTGTFDSKLLMRGVMGYCEAAIYLDGESGEVWNLDCFVAAPGLGAEPREAELVHLQVPFGAELVHYAVGPASCGVPGLPGGYLAPGPEIGGRGDGQGRT